ncbi:hypothetical protein B0H14DRAFT_2585857 [Mycena olivaceomarginata]|nr:hypothetical protein B0H14DRAFT_2585857 [Mycena olivaceomarginata]
MVGAKWLFLIYFGYRAVGYHLPEIFPFASIFGAGVTYYDEELKYLYHLLKNLPDVIPEGNAHDFTNYVPDPQKTKDFGCTKSVVSQALKSSFGWDLLLDKPVQGADAIHGLAGWPEGSAGGVGKWKKRANTTVWEAENNVF